MNISSVSSVAHLNSGSQEGVEARNDYSIAVAKKINDTVKQEGEAAVQLIETAAAHDKVVGVKLDTKA